MTKPETSPSTNATDEPTQPPQPNTHVTNLFARHVSGPVTHVDASWQTLVKIVLVVVLVQVVLGALVKLGSLLFMLLVGWIMAMGLAPIVDRLERKYGVPRGATVLGVYGLGLILVLTLLAILIPVIIEQVGSAIDAVQVGMESVQTAWEQYQEQGISAFPVLAWVTKWLPKNIDTGQIMQAAAAALAKSSGQLANSAKQLGTGLVSNAVNLIAWLFGSGFTLFMVLFFAFLLVLEKERILRFCFQAISPESRDYVSDRVQIINDKLGLWVRRQLLVCVIIGCCAFVPMVLLGVKNALLLAMITGCLEIIPVVGLGCGGAISVLLTLTQSWWLAVAVLVVYIVLNSIENNLLIPKLMGKAIGVSPLVVIVALSAGARLFGIMGVLLSVPFAAAVTVIIRDFAGRYEATDEQEQTPPQVSAEEQAQEEGTEND